mgnify:FL=1
MRRHLAGRLIICIFTVTSHAKEKAARNAKAYEAQASAEVAVETTEGQPAEHHYAGAYVAPAASLFKQAQEQSIGGIMDDQPTAAWTAMTLRMWCASSSASTSPAFPW